MRRLDLAGKKIGCLTPIEVIGSSKYQSAIWKCLCDYGNYTERIGIYLVKKKPPVSCKYCFKGPFRGYEELPITQWHRIEKQAQERNLDFEISIKDAWDQFIKQSRKCALSGLELNFAFHDKKFTASLDRIDNNKGYLKDNIQWIHKKLNVMRQNLSVLEFIDWCKLVANYNKGSTTN